MCDLLTVLFNGIRETGKQERWVTSALEEFLLHGFPNSLSPDCLICVWAWITPVNIQRFGGQGGRGNRSQLKQPNTSLNHHCQDVIHISWSAGHERPENSFIFSSILTMQNNGAEQCIKIHSGINMIDQKKPKRAGTTLSLAKLVTHLYLKVKLHVVTRKGPLKWDFSSWQLVNFAEFKCVNMPWRLLGSNQTNKSFYVRNPSWTFKS